MNCHYIAVDLHELFSRLSVDDINCTWQGNNNNREFTYPYQERTGELEAIRKAALQNFKNRSLVIPVDGQHSCSWVRITGISRIGKSRLAYESINIINRIPDCMCIYVKIDFGNGDKYDDVIFDRETHSIESRVAARLARRLGLVKHSQLIKSNISELTLADVFRTFLKMTVKLYPGKVIGFVIHLDEFQKYGVKDGIKNMIKSLLSIMRGEDIFPTERILFFLLPVVSGTAPGDLYVDVSDTPPVSLQLSPLTPEGVITMVRSKFKATRVPEETVEALLRHDHFRVCMGDTMGLPGLVDFMISDWNPDTDANPLSYDWGNRLYAKVSNYYNSLDTNQLFGSNTAAKSIISLCLTQTPVHRDFILDSATIIMVSEVERKGPILLLNSDNCFSPAKPPRVHSCPVARITSQYVICMPFTVFQFINSKSQCLPPSLMRSVSSTSPWTWQEFELLHAHIQAARINSFIQLKFSECSLQQVIPGAIGMPSFSIKLILSQEMKVYTEKKQFLIKKTDKVALSENIDCVDFGIVPSNSGIFLACPGNCLFDGRFKLHLSTGDSFSIFWQDRHSQLASNDKVTLDDISKWYKLAVKAVQNFHPHFALLFVTNRRLSDTCTVPFNEFKHLLLITQKELTDYLTTTFAHRGLVSFSTTRSESTKNICLLM